MKKFLVFALVVFSVFGITNVSAMSESALRAKVKSSYDINGNTITIPAEYIKQFNDYLDAFDISEEDCDVIAAQIDVLKQAAIDNNVTSFSDFTNKCEADIRSAAATISAKTGIKVTIGSDGTVTVYNYNSDTVFTKLRNGKIVNTASASIPYVAGIISLLGVGLFAYKARKA